MGGGGGEGKGTEREVRLGESFRSEKGERDQRKTQAGANEREK